MKAKQKQGLDYKHYQKPAGKPDEVLQRFTFSENRKLRQKKRSKV